jgi:radical SAM protein with 4Fe4S-binding SPASM domain
MVERLYATKNNVRRGFTRDLDEQIQYFKEGKLYTVEVKITANCSMRCVYCYAESTPQCQQQLSKETLINLIDDCAETGVKQINWGGGEPLERKDWYDIMSYAKEKGLKNLLMTNGMLLHNKETSKKVSDVVEMAFIHLDTLNKTIWENLHDTDSSLHEKQVEGVNTLLESGFSKNDLAISMTLTKPLFIEEEYKKTIDWVYDEMDLAAILFPYRNFGFAEQRTDLNPTFEEMATAYTYRNEKDGIPSGPGFGTKFYCGTSCHIGAGGEVMACSMVYPTYIGNILKVRFKDLYKQNMKRLTYHQLHNPKNIKGHCSNCINNTFCWGCRAVAELIAGGYKNSDPICWMKNNSTF